MRNRRKLLVPLAGVLIAVGALVWFTREKEPSYKGKYLSEWIAIHAPGFADDVTPSFSPEARMEAAEAIRHIGTNALPCLLSWINYEPPAWSKRVETLLYKLPKWIRSWAIMMYTRLGANRAAERSADALDAFEALGRLATPAVPELIRRISETDSNVKEGRAMVALAYIGPDAAPALISILSSPELEANGWAMECIRIMGANARPLVPVLVQRLQSTNETAVFLSARAVKRFKLDAELIVPALTKALSGRGRLVKHQAAETLGDFGELARPALPALRNALSDPDAHLQSYASNAIWRITTETLSKTQVWVPK